MGGYRAWELGSGAETKRGRNLRLAIPMLQCFALRIRRVLLAGRAGGGCRRAGRVQIGLRLKAR